MTRAMRKCRGSYTGYSIGCGIVWAAIFGVAKWRQYDTETLRLVFGGWAMGWTSATIARYVYPPPRRGQVRP